MSLSNANLTYADLTGADLTGAHLTRAQLTGAQLTGAENLRAEQVVDAVIDSTTELPSDLAGHPAVKARIAEVEGSH
ncbi:pentapeptide repeat-containing protein [Streptomyces sp. NPDC002889]|uniref:pentapeptide repeat-containing protein n=1 Tax=Streptomyces sp. NPDC002889 TaxID=3364669 RepID=UPI0036BA27CB